MSDKKPHEMDPEVDALERLASALERVTKGAEAFKRALDDLAGLEQHGGIRIDAVGDVMTCEIKPAERSPTDAV